MEAEGRFPPLKWAQNDESLFITIDLADCQDINIDIKEETNAIVFNAMSHDQKYTMNLELFKPVSKEDSRWNLKGRNVLIFV